MVKLKRQYKREDLVSLIQPPQTAMMYYGMKPEAKLSEYQFYFTVYDKNRTVNTILNRDIKPDYIFKSVSRHGLELDIQNSDFLSDKDFGAINKHRDKETHTLIGYIIEPNYTASKDTWDYAEVYLAVDNSIIVKWRH